MTGQRLQSGSIIGDKYRLERPIGRGGFSHVYRATHTAMERPVALKVFDPAEQDDAHTDRGRQRAQRFVREARLVSQLEHPNTVTIFDFGVEEDGKAYLVMEYIEGPTLKERLNDQGPMESAEAITIFLQILGSLEEAHHRQILHRDLKPANIMLAQNFKGEEVVKVLDFGIARILEHREDKQQKEKLFLGTPRYAAPEQLTGAQLTLATDIYGVGALLWECVVGSPMVPTGKIRPCIAHASSDALWSIPEDAGVDSELRDIIERAVHKSPSKRFANASAMIDALETCTTIERSDLPGYDEDSLLTDPNSIFDPNITHRDDSQNLFLQGPNSSLTSATPRRERPKNGRRPSHRNPSRPSGPIAADADDSLELALDLDDEGHNRSGDDSTGDAGVEITSVADENSAPSQTQTSPHRLSKSGDQTEDMASGLRLLQHPIAIAIFIVAGVIGLFALSTGAPSDNSQVSSHESTEKADGADDMPDETDDQVPDFELAQQSSHTVDDILLAIRSERWRVERSREPIDMQHYRYLPVVVSRGDTRLDVNVYETKNQEAITELNADISFPAQTVTLDHIVVHIRPRQSQDHRAVQALSDTIETHGLDAAEQ